MDVASVVVFQASARIIENSDTKLRNSNAGDSKVPNTSLVPYNDVSTVVLAILLEFRF